MTQASQHTHTHTHTHTQTHTHLHEAEAVLVELSVAADAQLGSSLRLSGDDGSDQGGVDTKSAGDDRVALITSLLTNIRQHETVWSRISSPAI